MLLARQWPYTRPRQCEKLRLESEWHNMCAYGTTCAQSVPAGATCARRPEGGGLQPQAHSGPTSHGLAAGLSELASRS